MLDSLKNLFQSAAPPDNKPLPDSEPAVPPVDQTGDSTATAPPAEDLGTVSVTLAKIIEKLPPNLRNRVDQQPASETKIQFPAAGIVPQLSKGSIKVTFGDLGAAAPEYFSGVTEHAAEIIELPLGEILPQLGPAMMKRKAAKKTAPTIAPQDFFGASKPSAPDPAPTAPPEPHPARTTEQVSPSFSPSFAPTPPASKLATTQSTTADAAAPSNPPAPEPTGEATTSGERVADLSLPLIVAGLPPALRALITEEPAPNATAGFPAQQLVRQLAQGKINVTFGELVAASSAAIFADIAGHEDDDVLLPLAEVLAKAGPGALKRKQPTKKLTGVEGHDFFGNAGKEPPAEASAGSLPPASHAAGAEPTVSACPQPVPADLAPELEAPPAPAVPQAATGAANSEEPEFVEIPLRNVMVKFPDELKSQISGLSESSVVVFPCARLGHVMKTGKVFFTWQEIKSWLRPTASFGANSWDSSKVDIPLRAIVGPFMAAMRGASAPSGAGAGQESPRAATPRPSTPSTPANPALAPSVDFFTPHLPGTETTQARPGDAADSGASPTAPLPPKVHLGELLGAPDQTNWTPMEIVQRVAGLPAISGAFISLNEGQIAAAEMPSAIKTDLVAFRIPKLFNQAAALVTEMQLEPMSHLTFTSGGAPWLVFKLGNIFFTVQGRAGDVLPVARLQSIALEIGRQRK
jgi:hypothetical protein